MKNWKRLVVGLSLALSVGLIVQDISACDLCGNQGHQGTIVSLADGSYLIAKGGRGGGFSSSRSSSRSSYSSSKPSSKPSSSGWSSSSSKKPAATKPVKKETSKSLADRKAYETAKANGKAFPTRQAAVADFKSKAKSDPKVQQQLSKDYPTTYATQPTTRPSHIPETYNGRPVIYQNGGYGYQGPDGFSLLTSYMLLDTMSDAMLMSSMNRQGYHVGAAPTTQYTTVQQTGWASFWSGLFTFLAWVVVILLLIAVVIMMWSLFLV